MSKVSSALGQKFSFTVTNVSAAAVVIARLAGIFDTAKVTATGSPSVHTVSYTNPAHLTAAGYPCDAVADDGTVMTDVTIAGNNVKKSVRQMREYLKQEGRIVKDVMIQSDVPGMFNGSIEHTAYNPFVGQPQTEALDLSIFKSVDQQAADKIYISGANLELAFESLLLMTFPANSVTSVTFIFG
jgi:hypothetical protein